jgi:peptidyl-prolyl cis-trans isomerase SurA
MRVASWTLSHSVGRWIAVAGLLVSATLTVGLNGPAVASDIRIIVNDTAITTLDIQNRARLLQVASHAPAGAANTKAAEDELIDEALRTQDAERRGIQVPDSLVDQAIADIASRSKLNVSQFTAALGHAGVAISTLRSRIHAQMVWGRIVRANLAQKVKNDESDLIAQMRNQEKSATDVKAQDYVLQRIVFAMSKTASAGESATRMREAEAFRSRFPGCDKSLEAVKGLRDVAVINVGRKLANEIPPELRTELDKTDVGRLTTPQPGELGIAMLAVCQKIQVTGESAVASTYDAETMSKQAEDMSKQLTQKLRQRANITYR